MEPDSEKRYVLKGTVKLYGRVYLGGTEWTGHPSNVVNGYMAMHWRGQKVLLEPALVDAWFRQVNSAPKETRNEV